MTEVWNPADLPFPQRYGPDDTLGAANEIKPETVRAAAGLIRQGRRYGLAQVLDEGSPAQMWRYWKHALLTDGALPGRELGANRLAFLEEAVSGATHSGTHLDGLAHIGIAEHAYNGHRYAEVVSATGVDRLGIESVPPIVTRGVLLDVAGLEGRDMLGPTVAITDEHLEAAAARQDIEVGAGDVVLVHTGWGALWGVDDAAYAAGEPGIGLSAARWCTDRRVAVIGADNWAVEAVGAERDDLVFPVHQHCIAQYGCYLLENVRTDELVRDRVHEFFCAILPARLRGATASIVQPVAIV
ncbi:MAG TPA: cyclase family protein [Solirubrobacteraceae bacterium]|nr:cyclase family protein [Solirubrobacteraceae bacterium]